MRSQKNAGMSLTCGYKFWGLTILIVIASLATSIQPWAAQQISTPSTQMKGCLSCHEGIERFTDGPMQEIIEVMGEDLDDPGGCVVCHGGTPNAVTSEVAHKGSPSDLAENGGPDIFFPDPGSIFLGDRTCG